MSNAGIAFTNPAPDIMPAAEAHDCIALFSRIVKSGNCRGNALWIAEKIAHAITHDVIATPMLHPALSPT